MSRGARSGGAARGGPGGAGEQAGATQGRATCVSALGEKVAQAGGRPRVVPGTFPIWARRGGGRGSGAPGPPPGAAPRRHAGAPWVSGSAEGPFVGRGTRGGVLGARGDLLPTCPEMRLGVATLVYVPRWVPIRFRTFECLFYGGAGPRGPLNCAGGGSEVELEGAVARSWREVPRSCATPHKCFSGPKKPENTGAPPRGRRPCALPRPWPATPPCFPHARLRGPPEYPQV
jgi:hypothetical protein